MDSDSLKSNPFYHVVTLSWQQLVVTIVCGVFLVPLRLILTTLMVSLFWVPYLLVLPLLMKRKALTVTKAEKYFINIFWKVFYRACGVWPKYEGKLAL